MASNAIDSEGELSSPPRELVKTIVLVGRTGNGKSATGNSILGSRAFKSMASFTGVTSTCERGTTVLENGQNLVVIDTPGLFDISADPKYIEKEMLNCIAMANGGICAILLIVSLRTRFSIEEEAGVLKLQEFFGAKIMDYVIVVFTGGDEFEEDDKTLDSYLCSADCPDSLKETLKICGNRHVVFNNKTKDDVKKSEQLNQLFVLVDEVGKKNGGRPYTDKLSVHEPKRETTNKLPAETGKDVSSSKQESLKEDFSVIEFLKGDRHQLLQELNEEKLKSARLEAKYNELVVEMESRKTINDLQKKIDGSNQYNLVALFRSGVAKFNKQHSRRSSREKGILENVSQYVVLRRDLMDTMMMGNVVTQVCDASLAAFWLLKDDQESLFHSSPSNLGSMQRHILDVNDKSELEKLSENLTQVGVDHILWCADYPYNHTCLATKPYPIDGSISQFFQTLRYSILYSNIFLGNIQTDNKASVYN